MVAALEATLETQGEIWFASREVGRLADTEAYFLNTALYYALGLAGGRYVDRQFEPTYIEDTTPVADEIYVSPAAPVHPESGQTINRITSTYNTSSDDYATINYAATEDPDAKKNLPSYGRRRVLGHDNKLRFYVLSESLNAAALTDRMPGYARLGKKRGKAKLTIEPVEASVRSGEYELGHPISAYDTEQTPVGNLITKRMRPTPLVVQATYEGEYVDITPADPDSESVALPNDLTFLRTKR